MTRVARSVLSGFSFQTFNITLMRKLYTGDSSPNIGKIGPDLVTLDNDVTSISTKYLGIPAVSTQVKQRKYIFHDFLNSQISASVDSARGR